MFEEPVDEQNGSWPLYDRIGLFLGLAAGVIGILATAWAAKTAEEIQTTIVIASITTNIALAGLACALVRQVVSGSILPEQVAIKTANSFCALVNRQTQFEAAVATFVVKLFEGSDDEESFRVVASNCSEFIQCIADAATYVIANNKGHTDDMCSANIKIFTEASDGSGQTTYEVWKRSRHSDPSRDEADQETREKEFRVEFNRMYDYVIRTKKHLRIPDLIDYLAEMEALNITREDEDKMRYREPSERTLSAYRSCLLIPIHGKDSFLRAVPTPDVIIPFGSGTLVGLLCIDSKLPNLFNEQYDIAVMKQLACHAFGAIKTLYALKALRNAIMTRRSENSDAIGTSGQ
jgi:hypothetical protein